MKKFFIFIAFAALVLTYSSCTSCSSEKKSKKDRKMEFKENLTSEDTVRMLKLADDCMELLKNKDIDLALAMLHEYDDSLQQVSSLSGATANKLRRQFEIFPVLKYEREYFSFVHDGANDVRYRIWFAEEPNPEQNGEPITRFMFNPVKVDGEWFLCVKTENDEIDELRQ